MTILPGSLVYTDRDFDSVRERLQLQLQILFPTWTDTEVRDFGNMLVSLFANVGDVLGFYQDAQANEAFLPTAQQLQSLLAITKLLGYSPRSRTAAQVDVVITIPTQTVTTTIPAGARIQTQSSTPVSYQLLADAVFIAGEVTQTVAAENSTSIVDAFDSSDTPDQEFVLSGTPFIEGSVVVSDATTGPYDAISNPTGWRQVSTFYSSTANDAHFRVVVDRDAHAHIRFGSGEAGRIPAGNINALSKAGGGVEGRVEANTLTRFADTVTNALGQVVQATVTNPQASSGGDAAEGIEQMRVNAPAELRVQERAVAREDYEISARGVSGIARAFHGTANEGVPVGENAGVLWLVPSTGLTVPSSTLITVRNRFLFGGATPKTNTYQLEVASVAWLVFDISSVVYLSKGTSNAAARASILAALSALFSPLLPSGAPNPSVDFGYYYQDEDGTPTGVFPWDDVRNAIRDANGVRKLDPGNLGLLINGAEGDVAIAAFQFPRLGTVTLLNGATGETF